MNTPDLCSATRADGQSCRFSARRDTRVGILCINYDPVYRAQQLANRERGLAKAAEARRLRNETAAFDLALDLTDRASVQAVLAAVIRLELTGRIPLSRSRNLLRALSIAVRNFDAPRFVPGHGERAIHDTAEYQLRRNLLDRRLETAINEAESRDAARRQGSRPSLAAGMLDHSGPARPTGCGLTATSRSRS